MLLLWDQNNHIYHTDILSPYFVQLLIWVSYVLQWSDHTEYPLVPLFAVNKRQGHVAISITFCIYSVIYVLMSCLSSAEMGLVWLVSQGDARVSASKTDLGSNTGASTLRLGCWPYTAGGFTEATWTAGALVTGASIAGSLALNFCCRLACFCWAWCRSHLSRSRLCRDGGFCFLAGVGWWVAVICPAGPYCVEFPLDDLCCHWKWKATPFSSCVIVHVAGDIHSPIHCKASASSYTAPGNSDFSEETCFILHWGKIHVKPEGTGIFLLSQKVCKLRMSPPIYRAAILHYCNDHVLLVLNEFHSHKKIECWILKFNSKATWEGNQSKRPHSKTATTRMATLSGITTRTATLLWSKRPHCFGQNGHIGWVATKTSTLFFGQNGHTLLVKTATGWALAKWAEVATKTATLHLVKTATNSEWYQFCEEWIPECVCAWHPKTSTIPLC